MTPQNCPVCGGYSEVSYAVLFIRVECCGRCLMQGPNDTNRDKAVAAWNRLRYVEEGKAE